MAEPTEPWMHIRDVENRFDRVGDRLKLLEDHVLVRPGLEDRLKQFVEQTVSHKSQNVKQEVVNLDYKLSKEIEHQEERNDERHEQVMSIVTENGKQTAEVKKYVWMGIGGIGALELIFKLVGK